MTLSHSIATTNLANNVGRENQGLAAKAAKGVATRTRQALGTITNKAQAINNNPATKNVPIKPRMTRSATLRRNAVNKDVPKEEKKEEPTEKAMDISVNSQSDAFSARTFINVPDIDSEDGANPQLVSIYVNDIYDYMRSLEREYAVRPRYMEGMDINSRMRAVLVDWLVQVHLRFHLLQETLYLTVALLDRFLQKQSVSRNKLQLVGVTAMWLASKYEEMYAPEVKDFVYITDRAYTAREIRDMEQLMLRTLGFNLGKPLPLHFLRRNSKAGEVDATTHTLAKYVMELTLVEYSLVHVPPSQIAAASLCFSHMLLNEEKWSETLHYYSRYNEEELMPLVYKLAQLVTNAGTGKVTAVKQKYQSSKFARISIIQDLESDTVRRLAAKCSS